MLVNFRNIRKNPQRIKFRVVVRRLSRTRISPKHRLRARAVASVGPSPRHRFHPRKLRTYERTLLEIPPLSLHVQSPAPLNVKAFEVFWTLCHPRLLRAISFSGVVSPKFPSPPAASQQFSLNLTVGNYPQGRILQLGTTKARGTAAATIEFLSEPGVESNRLLDGQKRVYRDATSRLSNKLEADSLKKSTKFIASPTINVCRVVRPIA
ncbi:MAG: hypothetical protein ACI8PT_000264 [Gammaproteobacteria bacterium]|jgi:hypothetical protein